MGRFRDSYPRCEHIGLCLQACRGGIRDNQLFGTDDRPQSAPMSYPVHGSPHPPCICPSGALLTAHNCGTLAVLGCLDGVILLIVSGSLFIFIGMMFCCCFLSWAGWHVTAAPTKDDDVPGTIKLRPVPAASTKGGMCSSPPKQAAIPTRLAGLPAGAYTYNTLDGPQVR